MHVAGVLDYSANLFLDTLNLLSQEPQSLAIMLDQLHYTIRKTTSMLEPDHSLRLRDSIIPLGDP